MNMNEIRHIIAKGLGLKPGKVDLVRNIQLAEGNFDCFATARCDECDQVNCLWRKDCLALPQKQEPTTCH